MRFNFFMRGQLVLFGVVCVPFGDAVAAPWTQTNGGIYARGAVSDETLNGVSSRRYDGYAEYGLTDKWTATAKVESVDFDDDSDFNREAYRLTLRRALWKRNGWVSGVEFGGVVGTTAAGVFGCEYEGAEGRISAGYSGARGGRDFYAFGDVAVLAYSDGCRRERIELGYGGQIYGKAYISQQIWLERGNQSADSIKYETLLSYRFDNFELAGGYREEIGGQFDEDAWVISITVRR